MDLKYIATTVSIATVVVILQSSLPLVTATNQNFLDDRCAPFSGLGPCECLNAGGFCKYQQETGICAFEDEVCKRMKFRPDECNRGVNELYAFDGTICNNTIPPSGKCQHIAVIEAVNLGGWDVVDDQGIHYQTIHDRDFKDKSNIACIGSFQGFVKEPPSDEIELWNTFQCGSAHPYKEQDSNTCVTHPIHIRDGGWYELVIKTLETTYESLGMRSFNVKLNGFRVINEIDVFKEAGQSRRTPVNIRLNFQVSQDLEHLTLPGVARKIPIHSDTIRLSFCMGECPETKDHEFQISAFSILQMTSTRSSLYLEDQGESSLFHQRSPAKVRAKRSATGSTTKKPGSTTKKPGGKKGDEEDEEGEKKPKGKKKCKPKNGGGKGGAGAGAGGKGKAEAKGEAKGEAKAEANAEAKGEAKGGAKADAKGDGKGKGGKGGYTTDAPTSEEDKDPDYGGGREKYEEDKKKKG